MTEARLPELVRDVAFACDAPLPEVLEDASAAFQGNDQDQIYFVGLIGGKDVGKSTLVNSLAGEAIATPSGHGEGTRQVLAYVHQTQSEHVSKMLSAIIPGKFSIHAHSVDSLRQQVLLDLPDIDSVFVDHVQTTRKMLRHMLFPIWVQSIEKYADQRPAELLRQVAAGNDPQNFIFVLSKGDLVVRREGPAALQELSQDHARRLTALLALDAPPRVFVTGEHESLLPDLEQLRSLVARDRDRDLIRQSAVLASARRDATLVAWLDEQDLPHRHERAAALLVEARQRVDDRLLEPLLRQISDRSGGDRSLVFDVAEEVARQRLWRWPMVNVLDTLLLPLTALVRTNVGASPASDAALLLDDPHRPLSKVIQGTFAELRWSVARQDRVSRDLTEDRAGHDAAVELYRRVERALSARRNALVERCSVSGGGWRWPIRYALTIGALAWFPFVQPVAEAALSHEWSFTGQNLLVTLGQIVKLLGAGPLLQGLIFVMLWTLVLWAFLRFRVHRNVRRQLEKLSRSEMDDTASVAGQVEAWCDDLLGPMVDEEKRLGDLASRVEAAREQIAA